jgi:membrane protein
MTNYPTALTRSDRPDIDTDTGRGRSDPTRMPAPMPMQAAPEDAPGRRARLPVAPKSPKPGSKSTTTSGTEAKRRPGWGRILINVYNETNRDNVSVMAAGVAFWTFLSIFPAMSALISIYGLVADPAVIATQVESLAGVLPQSALQLVYDQLHRLISAPPQALGLSLVISLLLALWYSMSGTGTLMQALTVAYEERDTRSILAYYGQSAALTIGIAVFVLVSLLLVAVVPAVLGWLPFPKGWRDLIGLVRWPVLAVLLVIALGFIYRFAPARRNPCWHWFSAGTIVAALVWLAGSAGFSYYVANFSSYDKTYGSLGTVVVLLMWLYLGSYIVLVGAELNSEIEQTRGGCGEPSPDQQSSGPQPATPAARAG